jgi:hypothetical protein
MPLHIALHALRMLTCLASELDFACVVDLACEATIGYTPRPAWYLFEFGFGDLVLVPD